MGASESTLSGSQRTGDEITTISERLEGVDPILERLKSLKITTPILKSPPTEGSLTDILVRKSPSSTVQGTIDPKVLLELFSLYHDWQEKKAQEISKRQEEIENKIEVADALAVKLYQRCNHSVSSMKSAAHHLSQETYFLVPMAPYFPENACSSSITGRDRGIERKANRGD